MYLSATTGTGRSLETKPERVWFSQSPTRSMVACRMVIRQEGSCHQIQERDRGESGQRERVSFMVSPVLYLTESYRMDLCCPSPTWSFYTPTRLSLGYVLHREESEPESDRSPLRQSWRAESIKRTSLHWRGARVSCFLVHCHGFN